ncbi:MAG: hypothetical protein D6737_04935, partial [Chloroflexi bacterium]
MYAQIAVNAPVKNTFDYHIPPELDGRLKPGHLVQVAFGTAQQHGIVVGISDHSDIEQTKPVLARLDPRPVVTEQQIELAYWMSERYLAPLSACLWLMLPPGITGGRDIRVTLLDEDYQTNDELEQDLIALLKRRGPLVGKQLSTAKALQGRDWRKAVEALAKADVVESVRVLNPPRVRPKKVKTVALAIRPDNIHAVARHLGKQSRRADLLEVIAASPDDAMLVDDALRLSGVAKGTLNRLAAEGHITLHDGKPQYVTLKTPPESVDEVLMQLRDGYKYLRILERLAYAREPMPIKDLYAETRCNLSDLRKLEDEGLIFFSESEVWRDSLAARDFVPTIAPALTPEQEAVWSVIEADMKWRAWSTPPPTPPRTQGGGNTPP